MMMIYIALERVGLSNFSPVMFTEPLPFPVDYQRIVWE